jgi:TonB family protein
MATQPTDTSKPRLRTLGDELTVIAQRAQAFTNASGTAIALSEGNADEIVCRARSGSAAPDVGAALRVEGTFTGLCIQSGKELRCDDAETDTRVDTAAIRALGIRSMVVTPIREDNKVIGVLACFAPTAHAFTITHVAVLKTMADQISILLQKERRAKGEGVHAEAPLPAPKPVASAPAPLPPPVVIKPASSGTATAAVPARVPAVAKAEPIKTEVAAPVPFPKREEKQNPEIKANFGTFDSVAAEDKKSAATPKLLMAAAAVLVVAAISTFFVMKSRSASTAVPVQHAQENASSSPGEVQTAASVPAPSSAQPLKATSQPVSNAAAKNVSFADNRKEHEHVTSSPEKTAAPAEKTEKPSPATVAISSGPSHLSASASAPQNVEISPTLSMSTPAVSLSALARPDSTGAPAVAQSELEPMRVLKTIPPVYPAIARVRRLSGSVVVQVTVGKDGRVHNPQFISGQPVFRDSAFDAVKQWQFKPAMLNGQPIEQTTQIKMDFKP